MKLSIIIPVYRVEQTLDRCLQSIASQTFADMEIILVDDGSPDRCPQMCDEWAQRDERIHVIHKENGGLSDARNAGIEQANGEYITFVDSDDYVEQDTYRLLMEQLSARRDIDFIEYPVSWNEGGNNQKNISFGIREYADMASYWLQAYGYEHAYAWNKIYKRELFSKLRFAKGRIFEDVEIMPLLLKEARCIATTDKGLYHYCYNAKGITAKATGHELNQLLESHLKVMTDQKMLNDSRYYMHVLNIQMDVYEFTGIVPKLPFIRINPFARNLNTKERIKVILLNILGIKEICKLNTQIHKRINNRS